TVSKIVGTSNDTRSSLAVLIFPDAASLIKASINSYCDGYGIFYRDTWKDFTRVTDSDHFCIYGVDAASGTMQQVVFNSNTMAKAGKSYNVSKFRADFTIVYGKATYQNTSTSSYIRVVSDSDFNSSITYTSNFTLKITSADCETGSIGFAGLGSEEYTKSMSFDMENVWKYKGIIILAFMVK
ncbi:MAG: hypothetical protein MJ152_04770, partial [Clostridia bacterium]|nr:hypothetical protein [Clostridia bacterium]